MTSVSSLASAELATAEPILALVGALVAFEGAPRFEASAKRTRSPAHGSAEAAPP